MPDAMVCVRCSKHVLNVLFILFFRFFVISSLILLQVHHGFYSAYHNTTLRAGVINGIKRAKELFGDLEIFVIGHSMGGAMASICALDLTVIIVGIFISIIFFYYWNRSLHGQSCQ